MKKQRLTKAGKITIVLYTLLLIIILSVLRAAEIKIGWIPYFLLFSVYGIIFYKMSEKYERTN